MSAFIQGKEHIDAVVRLALEGPAGHSASRWNDGTDGWYFYHDGQGTRVNADTADTIGTALVVENVASVSYRYPGESTDLPGPVAEYYREPYAYAPGRRLTMVEGFMALDGLEYQSCEHPGWNGSLAKTFLDALRKRLWQSLPGYGDAETWSI